jgi:hypothetical protein
MEVGGQVHGSAALAPVSTEDEVAWHPNPTAFEVEKIF